MPAETGYFGSDLCNVLGEDYSKNLQDNYPLS